MRRLPLLVLPLLLLAPEALADTTRIKLDLCIAGKCKKYGRFDTVTISDRHYIVRIDPHRCRDQIGYRCPTRYDAFTSEDGQPLRVQGYEPGSKSSDMFTVYVPRDRRELNVRGINGKPIVGVLELAPLLDGQRKTRTRVGGTPRPQASSTDATDTIDRLFERLAAGYRGLDATAVAELYADDASLLVPLGEVIRGRGAIEAALVEWFDWLRADDQTLAIEFETVSRREEGRLAYEVATFTIRRASPGGGERIDRGKLVLVLAYDDRVGWRIVADSTSLIER